MFSVRVYYEDTDFSGNVYHANYLKFFERARTEWLRAHNVHHAALAREGLGFAVRRMNVSFEAPAHIDDVLDVETVLNEVSGARVEITQILRRKGIILCRTGMSIALINGQGRPVRLPKEVRAVFGEIESTAC